MLAPLDNEIVFKKAFTEREVLIAFVKDIVGIDFNPGKIETEKEFFQNSGNIQQKYDVYAESVDHRVIVELQRVEYDYHFDRFLYYHNSAITQLQKGHKEYKLDKTVYTIIFLTQGYEKNLSKDGRPITDSVLISDTNPRNLNGKVVNIFGHKLIFLNSFYQDKNLPSNYKDWLELMSESINNADNYHVNENKKAIQKVIDIIDYENISPEDRRLMKVAASKKAYEKILTTKLEAETERANQAEQAKHQAEQAKQEAEQAKHQAEQAKQEVEDSLTFAVKILAQKMNISIEEASDILNKK